MNIDNWKTAIRGGREHKKRGTMPAGRATVKNDINLESTNRFDEIATPTSSAETQSDTQSTNPRSNPDAPKQILSRKTKNSSQPTTAASVAEAKVVPIPTTVPEVAVAKPTWADISESADASHLLAIFKHELANCSSLKERLAFVTTVTSTIMSIGIDSIQAERERVGETKNEKSLVRDLHDICSAGRDLATSVTSDVRKVSSLIDTYEVEKNSALDELKNFLAAIGVADSKSPDQQKAVPKSGAAASLPIPDAPKKMQFDGRYSTAVSGGVTDASQSAQRSIDMVSVRLGTADLVLPLSRYRTDVQPMCIRFASDLGVFLINIDGTMYSFCNGTFISRAPKSGDNTLFGKRCNPSIARCAGADCTYYHDPLKRGGGHTTRNMGVHYVVSELINGVASEKEILETARGRNKFIVEDIVQLAGMLLIKAFQVKKARDNSDQAEADVGDCDRSV
jgi:hypothetical protein